jgi:hypothetical protein
MIKLVISGVLSAALLQMAPTPTPETLTTEHSVPNVQTVQAAVIETTVPSAPQPSPVVQPEILSPKQLLMQQAGIPRDEWSAVDYIVSHESSWRLSAVNARSGAYGLCQALPSWKMASAGGDYRTNPVTQLKWCHQYAHARYGGWWAAYSFWKAERWW